MKKNWFVFCSLGLNLVLLLGIGYLNGEIKSVRSALHNDIQALEQVIDNEVSGGIAQIRSEMEEARRLHKSYDLHPTGMDSVSRTLLADFSLELKEWQEDTAVTLLDTPGHVDFSAETERTLRVLDCAILVINGTDGVQGHTRTIWKLL